MSYLVASSPLSILKASPTAASRRERGNQQSWGPGEYTWVWGQQDLDRRAGGAAYRGTDVLHLAAAECPWEGKEEKRLSAAAGEK